MKHIFTLVGKEMRLYFISPVAYVVAMVFLFIVDLLFYLQIVFYAGISMQMMQFQGLSQLTLHLGVFRQTFMNMGIILLFVVPLITMRLVSEEKKGRTLELLLTSPLTITEVVLAKFLAAFGLYLLLLAATLHVPLILFTWTTFSIKPLFAAYMGLALLGAVFVAFGLFASTVTENQIIAAVVAFGLLLGLWLTGAGGPDTASTPMGRLLDFLSLVNHLDNMVKGLLSTRDIGYFVSMTLLGLFLSHRVVESTRWK